MAFGAQFPRGGVDPTCADVAGRDGENSRSALSFRMSCAGALALIAFSACSIEALAQQPAATNSGAANAETVLLTVHAEGAQVYECKTDANGKLNWQFREPIATLFQDGKTVGRHYAGPQWELADGSIVVGKVESKADGATPSDIPLLKLSATSHRGQGILSDVATILRTKTHGGALTGDCPASGAFRSVPYSADYVFSKS